MVRAELHGRPFTRDVDVRTIQIVGRLGAVLGAVIAFLGLVELTR